MIAARFNRLVRSLHLRNRWLPSILVLWLAIDSSATAADLSVTLGIDGIGRAGMWAECRVGSESGQPARKVIVETFDGDGVAVRYQSEVDGTGLSQCYFQASPSRSRVKVSLLDESDATLASAAVEPMQLVPFTQKWILTIGSSIGIQSSQSQQGRLNYPVISEINGPDVLPYRWLGYSGIDLMVLPGSQAAIVNELQPAQKRALAKWVRQGGRILLTLGDRSAAAIEPGSWLREELGITIEPDVVDIDPRAIESFTNTQNPLAAYGGIRLPSDGGNVLLSGRTTDRQTVPIAKEYLIGLGRVFVLVGDLNEEPFASWPDRQDLLSRFLPDVLDVRGTSDVKQRADAGYVDLVGQIRRTLDRFDSHWVLPFRWLAGFLVLYLALIGPLDYWIINRLFGRPLLGWITFPLAIGLFAGLALYGARVATPQQSLANQISIIDIGDNGTFGRGFAWSQFLTSESTTADLSYTIAANFAPKSTDRPMTGWFGVPGNEFGGLSAMGPDDMLPAYQIEQSSPDGSVLKSQVVGLPMATASTKGLAAWWQFDAGLQIDSQLRRRRGTDLLNGSLTNPLPIDLLDGVLVYRGWAYLLPTRFAAGSQLPDVSLMTSKNVRWRLTRRSVDISSSATEPWNPEMVGNLDRLMEIAMLFETAGGVNYAQLGNRIVNGLDLSHILDTEHAILIGRCADPSIELNIGDREASLERSVSLVRVVIPVEAG